MSRSPRPDEKYTAGYRQACKTISNNVWFFGVSTTEIHTRAILNHMLVRDSKNPFEVGYRHALQDFMQDPYYALFMKPPQHIPPQERR